MNEEDDDLEALIQCLVDPSNGSSVANVPEFPSIACKEGGTPKEDSCAEILVRNPSIGTRSSPESEALSEHLSDKAGGEIWTGFLPSEKGESSNGGIPADCSPIGSGERPPSNLSAWRLVSTDGLLVRNVEERKENREVCGQLVERSLYPLADGPSSCSACPHLGLPDRFLGSVEKHTRGVSAAKDEGDSVDLSKKRKRQMRNRDSALRSRERKKMYVKDLETKSRFLEFECRRLEQALALCREENHALRLCAQSLEAATARQESAVLRTESLLLGSLLWLVALIWKLLPSPDQAFVEEGVGVEKRSGSPSAPTALVERLANERLFGLLLVLLRRRCRAARKKMRARPSVENLPASCCSASFASFFGSAVSFRTVSFNVGGSLRKMK